jgi:alanyl-tRNA synthetase
MNGIETEPQNRKTPFHPPVITSRLKSGVVIQRAEGLINAAIQRNLPHKRFVSKTKLSMLKALMTSAEIRQSYLDFFKSKQHTIVPSSSLMPDAPNLLFTNSGMNQFVPIFLGEMPCPYKPGRAADTQKSIRAGGKHNDLEDVGFDTYHHTFFEMLGNWSFGDYFKKEAIEWAWELVVGKWGFPAKRIYATVYKPGKGDPAEFDQEAYDKWSEVFTKAGLDPQIHVCYGNKKDNFWMMGETGPCGPCSELHVDLTPAGDTKGSLVNAGSSQCIEIWNLVFIQFNANEDGTFTPLPAKHVDTGMGFERVTSIIQCTDNFTKFDSISNYNTDVFSPLFKKLSAITGKEYKGTLPDSDGKGGFLLKNEQQKIDVAFRVVADHIRTLSFAIADGIIPSNEGRGYVLRRILRRAVRYGRQLGMQDLFFYKLVDVLAETMGDVFPEIRTGCERVKQVIRAEEESFSKTLDRGIELFNEVTFQESNEPHLVKILKPEIRNIFPGDIAFKLYDTYGFPLDLTQLMARELGLKVDEATFDKLMEEQKERSKASQKKERIDVIEHSEAVLHSQFVGYDQKESVKADRFTYEMDEQHPNRARVYLSTTPFYGEMGGQVGDQGVIGNDSAKVIITDTQRAGHDVVCHITEDIDQLKKMSGAVSASVNVERRGKIESHHSVAHIMHWALHEVLGSHVAQKGSYVGPDRLRFDFSHHEQVKPDQLRKIEQLVNQWIEKHCDVKWYERPYAEVKQDSSIMQFFGDKYGEIVRVVDIGGFSKELCGGTHVRNTKSIGPFRFISESAIAAGVRRVEAIAGNAMRPYLETEYNKLHDRYKGLHAKRADIAPWPGVPDFTKEPVDRLWSNVKGRQELLEKIEADLREWDKERAKQRETALRQKAATLAPELLKQKKDIGGVSVVIASLGENDPQILTYVVDSIKSQPIGTSALLACWQGDRVGLVGSSQVPNKVHAGKLIQHIAPIVGGKGGGRPDLAQGGGSKVDQIPAALAEAENFVKNALKN